MGATLKPMHVVAMGPIGSGKGTLSNLILNTFPNFIQISPGNVLRREMQKNTVLGQTVKEYIERGNLVPDELIVETVMAKLNTFSEKNWILDGFPRTLGQAKILHGMEDYPQDCNSISCGTIGLVRTPITVVLNLIVPEKVILERIANRWTHIPSGRVYNVGYREPKVRWKDDQTGDDLVQRQDDKPHAIRERLKIYDIFTKPVLEFYRLHGVKVLDLKSEHTDTIWPIVKNYLTNELHNTNRNRNA